ncbi:MAG: 2,5-dihydroxypyridine 5,6-dioxygenase [Gemmatimonas sp.]|nr:2,5-dihydroxypyridine 5,6-dioxygenase [Gemmatimonas sp.]
MDKAAELIDLFKREFELCRVHDGEVVAVLSEPATRPEYITASTGAATVLGAAVFEVRVPARGWSVHTNVRGIVASVPALMHPSQRLDAIREALIRCDFVVDLIPETILHVDLRPELTRSGTRILTIVEPPDALERMFPSQELKHDVEAVALRLVGGRQAQITSPAGTDLTYEFGDTPIGVQYGFADQPGRWDHWPSALVAHYPRDRGVNGTLVLDTGDILCHQKTYVAEPVVISVTNGYIKEVQGGLEARQIAGYLSSWDEPEVFAMSHIGIGVHPRAQWSATAFHDKGETIGMDARCYRGNFLASTGPNRWTGRIVEAHLDLALRGCTVTLDGDLLVEEGTLRMESCS